METAIIYLHGFGGSSGSRTALALKKVFREEIRCLDYDYLDPHHACNRIEEVVRAEISKANAPILVGTSLGAFWANHFAEKFGFQAILVNPSVQPHVSFQKYQGEVEGLTSDNVKAYEQFPFRDSSHIYKDIFSGENDDVVPTALIEGYLNGRKVKVLEGEGHRIENVAPIVEAINSALKFVGT
jgi:predicted esterase YcpF (UPF0227 family)